MNPWIAFSATIIAAVVTGIIGNRLVQAWQHRNWRNQQQFSGLEREYNELKVLTDGLLRDCGYRLSIMRELSAALKRGDWDDELKAYRHALHEWNRSLHSYYAQVTFHLEWKYVTELENYVHTPFVNVGRTIEREVRHQMAGANPDVARLDSIDATLNDVAGSVANFSRLLSRETELRRQEVFYGKRLFYKMSDIRWFSDVELIKLIFVSDIENFSVVRSTSDIPSPLGRRL